MLLEVLPSGPLATNAILLGCTRTKKAAVIDVPWDSSAELLELAQTHKLHVEKILLTHSHWDHIAEVTLLKGKINAPVFVHAEDRANLEKPGADGLPLLFPLQGVKPDGLLEDGQTFLVGELEITVIHTPGHTPGSVCFYIASEKVLIAGDTLFRGTIGNLSFPTSRPERMWQSLKKLSKLPADTKVVPGHGENTTIGAESWIANAEQRFNM